MAEAPVNVAHALCVYAEPLAARRRVVVVGDSSLGLDARLVDLGARTVHVYDPDAARAYANGQNAPRGVVVRELPAGEFDVREGAFDLAIVPDLGAIEDRASLILRVRRLVGPDGAAVIAAKSAANAMAASLGSALDYYEMYDLVALQFASVRMIGQVPFRGVALAELGESDEEPAVSVDTQLIEESDAPEVYVALAAQRDVRLEPYAIVQLPQDLRLTAEPPPSIRVGPSEADLAAALLRADVAEAHIEEQRTLVTRLAAEAERASRQGELEASLHDRTNKLKEAETRAGDHYVRAERLTHDLRRFEEELERQRDRAARLAKELDEEKKARTRAEVELGMVRKNPELAQARERVALLEEALQAAEEAVGVLQQRAVEAEKVAAIREMQIAAIARELESVRSELESVRSELEAARSELEVARSELEAARSELAASPRVEPEILTALAVRAEHAEARAALLDAQLAEHTEAQGADLAQLERLLRERAQAIAGLEHELLRRERMVRELVGALEDARIVDAVAPSAPPRTTDATTDGTTDALEALKGALQSDLDHAREENGALRSKLDALALDVARREGELQARTWRIAELEERLASIEARGLPAAPPPVPAGHTPAQAELNALRQALAQEHEARVALESGEELARARADIARQSVLLEQLARELEARDRARMEASGQAPNAAQT